MSEIEGSLPVEATTIKDGDAARLASVIQSGAVNRLAVDTGGGGGGSAVPNRGALHFGIVTIPNPIAPVQGPSVTIPDGFSVVVRPRITQSGTPKIYVGKSAAEVAASATRSEWLKGDAFDFKVNNTNLLWFSSDTVGAVIELFGEA